VKKEETAPKILEMIKAEMVTHSSPLS
jgi:hypothetical protein